jgi:hypothetical protein
VFLGITTAGDGGVLAPDGIFSRQNSKLFNVLKNLIFTIYKNRKKLCLEDKRKIGVPKEQFLEL